VLNPNLRHGHTSSQLSASRNHTSGTAARIRSIAIRLTCVVGPVFLLRMIAGLSIAFRLWRRATPLSDPDAVARSIADRSLTVHQLKIRVSPDLSTPVTIGLHHLPAGFEDWDEARLRVVLAHEQSHVRQGRFLSPAHRSPPRRGLLVQSLGWWLQRKLSELGEAPERPRRTGAGLKPRFVRRILLEFAATPRRSPLAGVSPAHSQELPWLVIPISPAAIERVLNDRRFRLAFLAGAATHFWWPSSSLQRWSPPSGSSA